MAEVDQSTDLVTPALVVLFADIAGSTALYDTHGDAKARDATAACLDVLSGVVAACGGRVVKTIGDEIMAVFHDPARAIMAGTDMQGAVRRAGEEGRFATGPLRIKVGLHLGAGLEEESEVFGEAASVAAQVVRLAKPDQVLTTAPTLGAVEAMLRAGSRFVDRTRVEGIAAEIDLFELIWEVSGLTQVADTAPEVPRTVYRVLHLEYAGETHRVDDAHPTLSLGRVAGNDVVVPTDLTSRHHADIELRRGRFHITDSSSNGTLVLPEGGTRVSLRRDGVPLGAAGRICLGGTPETNPEGVLAFRCE